MTRLSFRGKNRTCLCNEYDARDGIGQELVGQLLRKGHL
jgi:hypothetical protein